MVVGLEEEALWAEAGLEVLAEGVRVEEAQAGVGSFYSSVALKKGITSLEQQASGI